MSLSLVVDGIGIESLSPPRRARVVWPLGLLAIGLAGPLLLWVMTPALIGVALLLVVSAPLAVPLFLCSWWRRGRRRARPEGFSSRRRVPVVTFVPVPAYCLQRERPRKRN